MKAYDNNTDPHLIKKSIDAVLSGIPGLSIPWNLSKALYGNALELRHQKALEWVEMIRDNPDVFRKDVLESKEFQDGFIVALEEYIKLRSILKRGMARKIFIGFASAEDRENFELERYNMTLRQISANALGFVSFLKSDVEPLQEKRIAETLSSIDFEKAPMKETDAYPHILRQTALSLLYKDSTSNSSRQIMLPNKRNPKYPTIQGSMAVYMPNTEKAQNDNGLNELVMLGVITRKQYTTPVSDTDPTTVYHDIWDYSDYGRRFVEFIENKT